MYHGTSKAAVNSIKKNGLKPKGSEGADEWARKNGMDNSHQVFISGDRKLNVYFADSPDHALAFAQLAAEVRNSKPAMFEIELPISEVPKIGADEAGDVGMLKFKGEIKPEWLKEIEIPDHVIKAMGEIGPLVQVEKRSEPGIRAKDAETRRIYMIVFEPVEED